MMKCNPITGFTTFSCIMCEDSDSTCTDCTKELSVFNTGFKAGKNNEPSKSEAYEGQYRTIYQEGFKQGSEKGFVS
ncbi:hypothetical protein IRT38_01000 (plasmid) [Acinetobacter sp. SK-43]|uniref:hypothetical protein n=1 Tax=Acinetobacter sp. SK-43 TaxID=2785295 RepID=UPI00188C541B|nr:hypothetical protein [Acinetobacter sp. SK-43]MBF4453994.1 hypothetical protein [Acinetobacter sp. SK-43]